MSTYNSPKCYIAIYQSSAKDPISAKYEFSAKLDSRLILARPSVDLPFLCNLWGVLLMFLFFSQFIWRFCPPLLSESLPLIYALRFIYTHTVATAKHHSIKDSRSTYKKLPESCIFGNHYVMMDYTWVLSVTQQIDIFSYQHGKLRLYISKALNDDPLNFS